MSIITNWYPDPMFRHHERLTLQGCTIINTIPNDLSINLQCTTGSSVHAALCNVTGLPAGQNMVVSCRNSGAADTTKACLNVFDKTGTTPLISDGISGVPAGGGISPEFTIPSDGCIQIKLRAPSTAGQYWRLSNIFLGTPRDLRILRTVIPDKNGVPGSFAGDTKPI